MIERKEVEDAWMEDVLRVRAHLLLKLNKDVPITLSSATVPSWPTTKPVEKEKTKREGFTYQMSRYF